MLIIIILFSSYKVITKLNEYKKAEDIYTELQSQKNNMDSSNSSNEDIDDKKVIDLSNINSDYVGWIEIPQTNIDYPIVQSEDNSYYLDRDFHKNHLDSGSIFLDFRNNNFLDNNTIIYGHNMKNNTMFGELKKYKQESFFNESGTIKISEPSGEVLEYEVFSVYTTDPSDNYIQTNFNNEMEYEKFLKNIVSKSIFKSSESIKKEDKILTLSTCSYEFEDARTVVHAKLINSNDY